MNPFLPDPRKAIACLLLAAVPTIAYPRHSPAETWSLGIAGGYAGRFDATSTTYSWNSRPGTSIAPGTTIWSMQLLRDLDQHVGLTGHATYLPYGDAIRSNRAEHVAVAIGARYYPVAEGEQRGRLYLELSPALVWSRWRVRNGTDAESFARPGLVAGVGVHGALIRRLGVDAGLRYFVSTGPETRPVGTTDVQTLKGLRQLGLLVGLYYAL